MINSNFRHLVLKEKHFAAQTFDKIHFATQTVEKRLDRPSNSCYKFKVPANSCFRRVQYIGKTVEDRFDWKFEFHKSSGPEPS